MMTFAQLISQSDVVDGKIVVESSMEELSDHDDSVAEKLALLEVAATEGSGAVTSCCS